MGRPGVWVSAPADPFGDASLEAAGAAMLAQLRSGPAKPAQLAHRPDKLATCIPCGGVINSQTGECRCSD